MSTVNPYPWWYTGKPALRETNPDSQHLKVSCGANDPIVVDFRISAVLTTLRSF
jgi:hypothetical protein